MMISFNYDRCINTLYIHCSFFEIKNMIPKIIHQIWMQGADTVPSKYSFARATWREKNPLWEIKTWDEVELRKLIQGTRWENVLQYTRRLIQRADILRCAVLEKYGGVYVDMDMYCLKPLDDLLVSSKIQVGETSFKGVPLIKNAMRLNNGIIFAPALHSFWQKKFLPELLVRLQTHTWLDDLAPAWNTIRTTGPGLWSHFDGDIDIHIHPQEFFYSLKKIKGHSGELSLEDIQTLKDSYVYHMQDSVWLVSWEKYLLHMFIGNNWMISVPILLFIIFLFIYIYFSAKKK
jgi:Glycosyltransferase sugar-binding region containing DXD motif